MAGKIDPALREMLETSGRRWELVPGKRHQKLKVDGVFILAVPHHYKDGGNRQGANALAALKRHLKETT